MNNVPGTAPPSNDDEALNELLKSWNINPSLLSVEERETARGY